MSEVHAGQNVLLWDDLLGNEICCIFPVFFDFFLFFFFPFFLLLSKEFRHSKAKLLALAIHPQKLLLEAIPTGKLQIPLI